MRVKSPHYHLFITWPLPLLFAFSVFLLLGCSERNKLTHEETCTNRFEKLHEKFLKEKYSVIREPLSDLLSTCTGSGFVAQALFELAESHFNLKEWMEAQVEYSNLLRDFPSSEYCETAQFKLAECSKEQIFSIDRDQSKTADAIEDFQTFLSNYPKSALADSAKKQIHHLRTILAKKELKIAHHYYKMGEAQAAAIYYKSILKTYRSQINLNEVQLSLTQCYIALNQFEEAESCLAYFKDLDPKDEIFPRVQKTNQKLHQKKSKITKKKSGKSPAR